MTADGWSGPGCAGGTWLDTDALAEIIAKLYDDPNHYAADMRRAAQVRAYFRVSADALLAHAHQVGQAVASDLNTHLHATGQLPAELEVTWDASELGATGQGAP